VSEEKQLSNLNSVLIEGILIGEPFVISEKGPICGFVILSKRFIKYDDDEKVSRVDLYVEIVVAYELAKRTMILGKEGISVRIVGALWFGPLKSPITPKQKSPRIYINAEHVEFKPKLTSSEVD
jgi:hypothetical protein